MTQSYMQLQKQIETLQRQADKLRQQEIDGVVSRIKEAISHYGITSAQLGFGTAKGSIKAKGARAAGARTAKYSDGNGNTWAGRGPRPRWLRDALSAGKSLDEFASAASPAKSKTASLKGPKKRATKTLYRDQAGHSWSGMGPRPRWLKEALDGGKTLDELKA